MPLLQKPAPSDDHKQYHFETLGRSRDKSASLEDVVAHRFIENMNYGSDYPLTWLVAVTTASQIDQL